MQPSIIDNQVNLYHIHISHRLGSRILGRSLLVDTVHFLDLAIRQRTFLKPLAVPGGKVEHAISRILERFNDVLYV